jgi:hypothetical protein
VVAIGIAGRGATASRRFLALRAAANKGSVAVRCGIVAASSLP